MAAKVVSGGEGEGEGERSGVNGFPTERRVQNYHRRAAAAAVAEAEAEAKAEKKRP